MAIYTHNIAADIVELFDDLLVSNGIRVPSDEDDERGEDNEAALYGTVYGDLLDAVESILADAVQRAKTEDAVVGVFE